MVETKLEPKSFSDVQDAYSSANDFEGEAKWDLPGYDWGIEQAQSLNSLPLVEMANHLKMLLGAKISMERLNTSYSKTVDQTTDSYNDKIQQLNDSFEEFKKLSRHPNEEAYRKGHDGKLPEEEPIDYGSRKFGHIVLRIGTLILVIGFIIGSISDTYPTVTLLQTLFAVAGVLAVPLGFIIAAMGSFFLTFARHEWHISQPWASHLNRKRLALKNQILEADKQYCQEHDCSDDTLDDKFQYSASFPAIYSEYVEKMQQSQTKTSSTLDSYAEIVRNNVIYFPPAQTKDMFHLLKIYEALLNGVPTWNQAYEHVSQDERVAKMTSKITEVIKTASTQIANEINDAKNEIAAQIESVNDQLGDISDQIEEQTSAINSWGEREMAMQAVQTGVMLETNKNVSDMSRRYDRY